MGLTIDLYANDGSPIGITPKYINGRGVGGAELAMMTWAKTMAQRGHKVTIYNNPDEPGEYDGVTYLPQNAFNVSDWNRVLITYRSPNPYTQTAMANYKIHWSTDQYTIGNFATDIFPFVDKVVCISPYHVQYHKTRYGVENNKITHIDLGVQASDYQQDIKKIDGRCIFCSIPDRGLDVLLACWPRIKEQVPHASLIITSDYTLWGSPNPGNHQHRAQWLGQQDVAFLGKIPREQLIKEQLAAQVQSYPCTYEELFCISAAECQVAGAYPVTTVNGALQTTNEWGTILEGNPLSPEWQTDFIEQVIKGMSKPTNGMRKEAVKRFDWDVICEQWEKLINN